MQTKYQICNLSCPTCAGKIEKELKSKYHLEDAQINLVTGNLLIRHNTPLAEGFLEEASQLTDQIETGVFLKEVDSHKHEPALEKRTVLRLTISLISLIISIIFSFRMETVSLGFALFSYVLSGEEVFEKVLKNFGRKQFLDETILILLATLGAFLIKAPMEAAAAMFLYVLGEEIQNYAVFHSKMQISALLELKPEKARRIKEDEEILLPPEELRVDDIILIRPGEKVPVDGIVLKGSGYLDVSALTGESVPIFAESGQEILSGSLVKDGVLLMQVLKEYANSTISKMLDLIEHAGNKKSKSEKMMTRFAAFYTPIVVGSAVLLTAIPVLFLGQSFSVWAYRSCIFLAASCPCALIISIPLTYFAGLGSASKHGVLIKGANYLEVLSQVKHFVFDKTGTLTKGNFEVVAIRPADGISENELLTLAARIEHHSNHPIALSIKKEFLNRCLPNDSSPSVRLTGELQDVAGKGIAATMDSHHYLCGNASFLMENGVSVPEDASAYTMVYLAKDDVFLGSIAIADELKPDTALSIYSLRQMGATVRMLTGDGERIAKRIGQEAGISNIEFSLLPHQKQERMSELLAESKDKIAFIGDGINDAAVLKSADVGIAMGGVGADLAVESADIILSNDSLSSLLTAIRISHKVSRILKQNMVLTLGFKFFVLILGAIGIASLWLALFADVGIMILAVLNALRAKI